MKTVLILNRHAGVGLGQNSDLLEHVTATIRRRSASFDVAETRGRGDASRITSEAVVSGVERIVAVGGDGTLSQCVNGYLGAGASGAAELGLIPVGTGRDFVRSLWPDGRHGVGEALERVLGGVLRRVDAARLLCGDGGRPTWFINAASIGLGGRVADRVERRSWVGLKRVIGRHVFALATARELADRPNWTVQVAAGVESPVSTEVSLVVVANGRFFGGAMEVAPDARVDDGMLDVVIARAMPAHQLMGLLLAVYRGRHLRHPMLSIQRTSSVTISMERGVAAPLEADGEPAGRLPVAIEVVPGAVPMRV
ncbi:MAG: diacylglycerol/lipid kinase family protein [Gemmatimonadota bacterium]